MITMIMNMTTIRDNRIYKCIDNSLSLTSLLVSFA